MFTLRSIVLAVLALAAGVSSPVLADTKQDAMKSLAAREAKAQFERKVQQADREFHEKLAAARREYVTALDKAKDEATKRADLDEALRIRAEAEEIKKVDAAPVNPMAKLTSARNDLAARLLKTSWSYPSSDSFTLNADGSISRSDNWATGLWVPLDDRTVLVVYAKVGMVDVLTFDDKTSRATASSLQVHKTWEPKKVDK